MLFFLPFPSHLIYHLTSCIRAYDHLRVALLLQMMFAAEPFRSCYRPPKRRSHVICSMGSFFLPFSFFLYSHLTSCIRDSRSFARRFAPSNDVRCGTISILFSPTIRKHHVIRSVVLFSCLFPFSLQSYNLLHPRLTTFCASLRSFKMCSLRNQFDPVIAHHNEKFHVLRAVGFFIAIFLPPYLSFNLLHPRSRSFARRFAPSNVFATEPVRSCYRPP